MSINDLLDADLTGTVIITFIIFVVIMIIAIPAGLKLAEKTNNDIYGDDECGATKEEKNAKIIARRATPHPSNQATMVNRVVFELENGNRVELAIKDHDMYGVMVEGDCGTLHYQGKKFIRFERGISNEI